MDRTKHWIGVLCQKRRYRHPLTVGLLAGFLVMGVLLAWLWEMPLALAGPLTDRVATFPQWDRPPLTQPAQGDLVYPAWFEGTWQVTSILLELSAPLAPEITTPGFEGNERYLQQPLKFTVRFLPASALEKPLPFSLGSLKTSMALWSKAWQGGGQSLNLGQSATTGSDIVADRAFNGLNIAQAYLGTAGVKSVVVDPADPNRQITTLSNGSKDPFDNGFNHALQLVAIVTERAVETPSSDRFLATEVTQQFFRTNPQVYLNQVETTTVYEFDPSRHHIHADQFTAIYLSPQDPQYFQALDRPVALYHYGLDLAPQT